MPYHEWGDEDFDWKSLDKAISEVDHIMTAYGRIGVHSKEKYGTARWSLYLCTGSLHSLTHPGYVYSRYPKWLWSFDVRNKPIKHIAPIIRLWQKKVIQYAFTVVCMRYPHIRDEIIMDAPRELLPPDLAIAAAKMWSNTCDHCKEWSTTDHYKCPHCDKVKDSP
jgi:hypothetical protein